MTAFTTWPNKIWSDGRARTFASRLTDGAVSITEMEGFVGDGVTPDDAPVAAAIAKAIAENKGAVIVPAGCNIAISEPVFLGKVADPTNASFSLALITPDGTHGDHNGHGAWFPLTAGFTAIKVGPGQMMMVANQTVRRNENYRGYMDPGSIAYSVAAESGGCSGFSFINCHAFGAYTMFDIGGFGAGSLADSGYFEFCSGANIVVGYNFHNSQAYIQTVLHNRVDAQKIIYAALGHNVCIVGGNYSGVGGRASSYTITNVSAVTANASGNGFYYTFTAEIVTPDSDIEDGLIYHDAVIDDAQFGLIPLTILGYNAGTNTISLETLRNWSKFYGQGTNLVSGSNLQTRIQAATTLGCAERLTPFTGSSINQTGTIHLENAAGHTCFLDASAGFDGGTTISTFENIHANYDVMSPTDGDAAKQTAKRKISRCHPFIKLAQQGGVIIKNFRMSQIDGASIVIDSDGSKLLEMRNMVSMYAPNVRCYTGQNVFLNDQSLGASAFGDGVWLPNPFVPNTANSQDVNMRKSGYNRTEHRGWLPSFETTPRLTPADVTTLASLPTFTTGSNVLYPLICGGVSYSIGNPVGTDSDDLFIKSKHKYYSYGQDLTTTNITGLAWSFRGKTRRLNVNLAAFERLFPGLGIFLSHASINSGTPFECVITAVSQIDLYCEVSDLSSWLLPGTAGTEYTGTTIGQAAYVFKKVTGA